MANISTRFKKFELIDWVILALWTGWLGYSILLMGGGITVMNQSNGDSSILSLGVTELGIGVAVTAIGLLGIYHLFTDIDIREIHKVLNLILEKIDKK